MMKQMKLWILVAAWFLWSTVLMVSIEARTYLESSLPEDQEKDMIIRSVAAKPEGDVSAGMMMAPRIVGVNNLCADVVDGFYFNGNKIQLYPCKPYEAVNQEWTLGPNGRIQSNGMCMTASGSTPGSYITINTCDTDASVWEVQMDGTILNPSSSLVLTANSGTSGTILTLETNVYALGQGWMVTNNSKPLLKPHNIVGFMSKCLEAQNYVAQIANCAVENSTKQLWVFYADGSIRLNAKKNMCLTNNGNYGGSIILIVSCSARSSFQRWMYGDRYGTANYNFPILNLNSSMVLDVNPLNHLYVLILLKYDGGANQLWHLSS